MAGRFELFVDADARYRFRLRSGDGTVMAVSKDYATRQAAVAAINAVRECAGTGLISDLCATRGQRQASSGASRRHAPGR